MKDLTTRAADNIRILAASMVEKAKSGHPGGAMGGADFVNILYSEYLNYNPEDPRYPFRDRFFLDPARLFRRLDRILLLLSSPVRQTKGFQRALLTERTSARDADKRAQLNPCLIIFTWMK